MPTNQNDVRQFWEDNPCGEGLLTSDKSDVYENFRDFLAQYDQYRYEKEKHILSCLDQMNCDGKDVLEIGLGQGADSEQIIKRGANWSGVDLTAESIARVRARMQINRLPFSQLIQGSATNLPFANDAFDIVYSFGVLHHIPNIRRAQGEIARVLKPGGQLYVMLYAKHSLNYWVSIWWIRRLALIALYSMNYAPNDIVRGHLENAKRLGLFRYLQMKNFVHRNTDGPDNPYAKVYTLKGAKADFCDFDIVSARKYFMHAPPLPVKLLPFERLAGWHLWLQMRPKQLQDSATPVS